MDHGTQAHEAAAYDATTDLSVEEAEQRLRDAFAAEGFGVLTRVDVAAVLKEKLDQDVAPYVILGVCNPRLAHEALGVWGGFGLIAPCHVAVHATGDRTTISAFNPLALEEVRDNEQLRPLAHDAREAISRAIQSVADAP